MREEISALMDDELDGNELGKLVSGMKEELRQDWQLYHMIGDAMRDPESFHSHLSFDIGEALAKEPTLLAPVQRPKFHKPKLYALSAAASLAAVALVGWIAKQDATVAQPEFKEAQAVQIDASSKAYLQAHQEVTDRPEMMPGIRTVSGTLEEGGQ